jgi:N-acyl-D-aspartate/D-glutamate deacylase
MTRFVGYERCSRSQRTGRVQVVVEVRVALHTTGAAHQLHGGNSGIVCPGKRADLIVLDRDITKVPVKKIRATKVQYTLVSGRVVHDAGSETGRARVEAAQRIGAQSTGRTSGKCCCQGHCPAQTDTPRMAHILALAKSPPST